MRLHVHRSGAALLQALAAENGCYYATFGRSTTAADVLRAAEAAALEHRHHNVADVEFLRAPAEQLLREFFELAGRGDPHWHYAHSSRVLLSIPDYPDVALLFLLRTLGRVEPGSCVHALASEPWMAALVEFEARGGEPPAFHASRSRALARAARSFARSVVARRVRPRCDVLIFTLGENVAGGGPDAYFGDFAQTLAESGCATHTVYAAPGRRLRLPASSSISPLESYLRPLDVPHAYREAMRALEDDPGATRDDVLVDYLRAREHHSGETVMLRILAHGFDRMLAALRPRTLAYPFENRSWEKTLLKAARAQGAIRCVGYQHSSITPRHLAFSSAAGLCGLDDLPDTIVTCGEVTADLLRAEIPQARSLVRVGAALRARRLSVPPPVRGVLAPISSSRAEAWEMLRLLHEAAKLFDQPVIVRTHPTIPVDDLYAQFDWPTHVRLSRGRALAQDFAETGTVVYSSSTVALEGLLYGRLPIHLDIGDIPSGDPMHGAHAFIFRASGASGLTDALARLDAMETSAIDALRDEGRAYAERYLIEPTAERVRRMAAEVAQC